jgi:putative ABC transport system permease protein
VNTGSATLVHIGPALVVALLLLVGVGVAVAGLGGTGFGRAIGWAAVRATLQLCVLGLVVTALMHNLGLSALFIAAMATAASYTAAGRVVGRRPTARQTMLTGSAVALPAIVLVAALVAAGVVPPRGLAVIPVAGIVMGGAMAAGGLGGRRAREEISSRWGEVEAGMALGLEPAFIRLDVCRAGAASALVPPLDQTRTVGLVTIPGAFVGMVLGGASPLAAAVMQLLVLLAIMCSAPISVVLITRYAARGWYGEFRPTPP